MGSFRPRPLASILVGGLAVGILDGIDAIVFFGFLGVTPTRIFQYISSGLLGRAAFEGGGGTVALGVALHFVVAFLIATVFNLATLVMPTLLRRPIVWGMLYGVAAYFVMNRIVIPLSAATSSPPTLGPFLNGVVGHALLVGLPIALVARWFATRSAASTEGG
jgi:hypothetical protein